MPEFTVLEVVLASLKPFVRESRVAGPPEPVHRLIEDLGVDSSRLIEVVLELEDVFGIEIPDTAVNGFKTLGDLVSFVDAKRIVQPA